MIRRMTQAEHCFGILYAIKEYYVAKDDGSVKFALIWPEGIDI